MDKGTKISVVVCTYNRVDILSNCLQSLAAQAIDEKLYEVIVVNNNSTDETQKIAEEFAEQQPNFRVIIETKQGLSHARNRGYKEACGEYVAYIDDDAKAPPDWVERILTTFETVTPEPVAVGGQYHPWYEKPPPPWFSDEMEIRTWGKEKGFLQSQKARFGFSGSNMIIKKSTLEEFGGFTPGFGMQGNNLCLGEEAELFSRIFKKYPRFWYDPEIKVEHLVPQKNMTINYRLNRAYHGGIFSGRMSSQCSLFIIPKLAVSSILKGSLFPFRVKWHKKNWQISFLERAIPIASSIGFIKGFLLHKK